MRVLQIGFGCRDLGLWDRAWGLGLREASIVDAAMHSLFDRAASRQLQCCHWHHRTDGAPTRLRRQAFESCALIQASIGVSWLQRTYTAGKTHPRARIGRCRSALSIMSLHRLCNAFPVESLPHVAGNELPCEHAIQAETPDRQSTPGEGGTLKWTCGNVTG